MAKWVTVKPSPAYAEPRLLCPHRDTTKWFSPNGAHLRVCRGCGEIVTNTPSHMMLARGKQRRRRT